MLEIGFQMRGEIVWNKGAGAGVSMAWGSWQSASNPVLRDVHEYILVFSKGAFMRKKSADKQDTISKEQFMEWTKSGNESQCYIKWTSAPFPSSTVPHHSTLYHRWSRPLYGQDCSHRGSGWQCIGYEIDPEYVDSRGESFLSTVSSPGK
jgi:site-specific DNA-methyltransferase (adenine-specific)